MRTIWSRLPGAGLLLAIGLLAEPARAAILEVTLCTDTTPVSVPGELRHAIVTAADGDVILLPACVITLTGAAGEDANAGGDLDVFGRVLHLQGAGVGRTILDGGGLDRVLDVGVSILTVSDLTIRNGHDTSFAGGGALLQISQVALSRVAIVENRSTALGGGGLAVLGGVRLVDSTVAGNRAEGTSTAGGGIRASFASLVVEGTTISGNTATGSATATGGGLALSGAFIDLRQSTLSGNVAEAPAAEGGGLYVVSGEASLVLATVAGNVALGPAATGGGLQAVASTVSLRGTILADNDPGSCGPAGAVSADHNLQDDASCPLTRPSDQSGVDPRLGPLADHGGLTATHLPLPGSPALDRGPTLGCPGADQRGVTRPRDGDGNGVAGCDVGSVERRATGPRRAPGLPRILDGR